MESLLNRFITEEKIRNLLETQYDNDKTWNILFNYGHYNKLDNISKEIIHASQIIFENSIRNCYYQCLLTLDSCNFDLSSLITFILNIYENSSSSMRKKCSKILVKYSYLLPENMIMEIYLVNLVNNNIKSFVQLENMLKNGKYISHDQFKYFESYINNDLNTDITLIVSELVKILELTNDAKAINLLLCKIEHIKPYEKYVKTLRSLQVIKILLFMGIYLKIICVNKLYI
jgi:hypothetical protein